MGEARDRAAGQPTVYDFTRAKRARELDSSVESPQRDEDVNDEVPANEPTPSPAERIHRLKEQIARGQYQPDAHEIAKKILERGL